MKSKTNAAFLLLGTFLLGGIAGAASFSLYQSHVKATGPKSVAPRHPGSHDIVEELARGLEMDAAQKEKLRTIISQSRDKYRALSKQFRPQYDAIRAQTRQEMRQILHENQKARFEQIIEEMDSRHKNSGKRPPNK